MKKKAGPDWETIEREYRAGALSVRAIGDTHNTSEGTIRSRAKKCGWLRDLSDHVRVATQQKISRTVSRTDFTQPDVRMDAEIVDAVASKRAGIVTAHITRLEAWQEIAEKLAKSLNATVLTEDNQSDYARILNAGVDAELKVIKAQRQAYNIDDASHEESYESRLARVFGQTVAD